MLPTVVETLPSKTSLTVPWVQKCRTTLQRMCAQPHKEFGSKDRSWCSDEEIKGDWQFPSLWNILGKDKVLRQRTQHKTLAQRCTKMCSDGWVVAHARLATIRGSAAFRWTSRNCSFSIWKQGNFLCLLILSWSKPIQGKEKHPLS